MELLVLVIKCYVKYYFQVLFINYPLIQINKWGLENLLIHPTNSILNTCSCSVFAWFLQDTTFKQDKQPPD